MRPTHACNPHAAYVDASAVHARVHASCVPRACLEITRSTDCARCAMCGALFTFTRYLVCRSSISISFMIPDSTFQLSQSRIMRPVHVSCRSACAGPVLKRFYARRSMCRLHAFCRVPVRIWAHLSLFERPLGPIHPNNILYARAARDGRAAAGRRGPGETERRSESPLRS